MCVYNGRMFSQVPQKKKRQDKKKHQLRLHLFVAKFNQHRKRIHVPRMKWYLDRSQHASNCLSFSAVLNIIAHYTIEVSLNSSDSIKLIELI